MKAKIMTVLCWAFYAGLIYTFFNPVHDYLNYLANARTLYLVVHIPLQIVIAFFVLLLGLTKSKWKEGLEKEAEKGTIKKEYLNKIAKEFEKLNKFNLTLFLNRVIYYSTTLVVFIGLGDTVLGVTMLTGCILGYVAINQLRDFAREINNVLS